MERVGKYLLLKGIVIDVFFDLYDFGRTTQTYKQDNKLWIYEDYFSLNNCSSFFFSASGNCGSIVSNNGR